jgi:amidophosphoribosyltransferase
MPRERLLPRVGEGTCEDHDHPREACGVLGIVYPDEPVPALIADGLHALQHRGQEAAGLAVSHESRITVVKNVGLVTDVLNRRTVGGLEGHLGIGHTRYSTTGSSTWENAQPCFRSTPDVDFALGHNGNLTNTRKLSEELGLGAGRFPGNGDVCGATNDSDVIAELVSQALSSGEPETRTLEGALTRVLPRIEGAFSLVLMDAATLIGVRDPNGFRPLCMGRLDDGWVLASETAAIDALGAEFVREILPGEMLVIEPGASPRSLHPFPKERVDPRLCIF